MRETPRDLNRAKVRNLLDGTASLRGVGVRIDALSGRLLGAPYQKHPLIGSPEEAEVYTASLEGFDCVTYVEAVLALAGSRNADEFADRLRRLRYADGVVDWKRRNHYMSGWIRQNQRAGFVRDRTGGAGLVERERRLSVVPGLPEKTVNVRSIGKRAFLRRAGEIRRGDLAFFASTRRRLDIFHCGILIPTEAGVRLRHAARSRGRVVEQDLAEFLVANRMPGVILVRPQEPGAEAA